MDGFGVAMIIVYLGIAIFMITLAIRFVTAMEKMAESMHQIAGKFDSK